MEGPEHRLVAMNDAYRFASGVAELIGVPYKQAFPERVQSLAYLDQAYSTGERVVASGLQRRFVRVGAEEPTDGYVTAVLQPLPGADGATGGIAIFSIDVTQETLARQRAEQVESEELAILDLLTAGVIVTDEHGTVVKVNQRARDLLSMPETATTLTIEVAARYDLRLATDGTPVPYEELPTIQALRGQCAAPRTYLVRDPVLARDRTLRVSALPLRHADGLIRGSVTTVPEA